MRQKKKHNINQFNLLHFDIVNSISMLKVSRKWIVVGTRGMCGCDTCNSVVDAIIPAYNIDTLRNRFQFFAIFNVCWLLTSLLLSTQPLFFFCSIRLNYVYRFWKLKMYLWNFPKEKQTIFWVHSPLSFSFDTVGCLLWVCSKEMMNSNICLLPGCVLL